MMPAADDEASASSILTAALQYAERAPIFPVGRDNKRPLTQHGFKDASQDPDQIRAWWGQWPDANVALAIPDDILVIDVDPRNGGDLNQLEGLPETRMAETPAGGWHLYFKVDPDIRLRGQMGPGIDLKKGGRGYVLLPPSRTDAGEYRWMGRGPADPIVALPDSIVGALSKAPRQDAEVVPLPGLFSFQKGTPYGESALEREVGRMVTALEGERNQTLNRSAFSLGQLVAGGELKEQAALEDLARAAERAGLEPEEIEGTLRSGFDSGLLEPRSAPEKVTGLDLAETGAEPFWMDWEAEEEPASWLFYPILPEKAYTLMFGSTESSKSIFMQWMGARLSREGRRVSHYSLENPAKVDRERMRRLKPDRRNFRITQQPLDLSNADQVRAMVERDTGQDLIVLDTYSHAFGTGPDDENAKAISAAQVVRYIMFHTGAAVVVIDHTGFGDQREPRGASAKRQQVDVAVSFEKNGDWIKGKPAPFRMENRKAARYANPFRLTGAVLDTEDGGLDIAINERFLLQEPPP